jgi:hypothetical protein
MASDRSRAFDRPRLGYTGVVAQQGRVTLDRDVNAQAALTADRIAFDALAFVGPCGTPDDGYRITTPRFALRQQDIVEPIRHPSPPDRPPIAVDYFNFRIAPGSMYLGGQVVTLPRACAYANQPEWPDPTAYTGAQHELVWLDVVETEVGATEDADLVDVALGGPDTTARRKLLQRIRRQALGPGVQVACGDAWSAMAAQWAAQGLQFDPATMALMPEVRLQIGFTDPVGNTNPCDPVASGGYLGPENQMLRMRVTLIDGAPWLVWSYDNASALYQVKSCDDGKTLVLASDPPDVFQYPAQGQWVEVLGAAAVHGAVDASVPGTLHYTAETSGTMHPLAQPYGQTSSDDATNRMVLDAADPLLTGFTGDPAAPVFVRVWQNAQPIGGTGSADIALVDVAGVATGIVAQLRWTLPALADGACWEVAVRPSTPQGVYPVEYLQAPQQAIGPRRWACPLAVIDWTVPWDAQISDCRNLFDTLVELTRRRAGCCSFTIDPGQAAGGARLQAAIDRARDMAQLLAGTTEFTVCLGPGNFALTEPLRFDAGHSGLVLEACAGRTVLCAAADADASGFVDGLVVLTGAQGVTLRGLEIQPVEAPLPPLLLREIAREVGRIGLNADLLGAPRVAFGLRIADCAGLTIDQCTIVYSADRPDPDADLVGGAIFVQGANGDLAVTGCRLISQVAPTFTPLRLGVDSTSPVFTHVMEGLEAATQGDRAVFLEKLGLASAKTRAAARRVKRASTPAPDAPAGATTEIKALTLSELGDQKTIAGWAAIVARRMGDAAAAPIIAIAGLLAADGGSRAFKAAQNPCTLGDAHVTGTVATALGFGVLVTASFDSLRVQDNRCIDGVAGVWISMSGAVTPPRSESSVAFYPSCQRFEEFQFLQALAAVIAPPADPSPARFLPMSYVRKPPTQPHNALFVSGNDIRLLGEPAKVIPANVQQRERASAAVAQSAVGLMLALCRQNGFYTFLADRFPPGATVTGNRVWSGSGYEAPAALVTLSPGAPLAMAGNIFINAVADERTRNEEVNRPPALSIEVVSNIELGQPGVAVVGNAVEGWSNLQGLHRPPPLPSWHMLNADPT